MKFSIVGLLALPFFADAVTHTVQVGQGGLRMTPQTIKAAKGDKIAFHFAESGHDVSQGNFQSGCQPFKTAAFYSGTGPLGKTWTIEVNQTTPMAFYCSKPGHCQAGMYGVINPAGASTLAAYKTLASKSSGSKSPPKVRGGTYS